MPISVLPGSNVPSVSNPPVVPNIVKLKKKRISWKNIVIGVVVGTILVAAVLGGWYYYITNLTNQIPVSSNSTKIATPSTKKATPSAQTTNTKPAEIAGWKTYTNTTYGFSLEYPGDWGNVKTANLNPNYIVQISKTEGLSEEAGYGTYEVDISIDEDQTMFNKVKTYKVGEITKVPGENQLNINDSITRFSDVSVEGFQAVRYKYESGFVYAASDAVKYIIKINKNGKYYSLVGSMIEPDYFDDCKQMMDKILSTFKFL